MADDAVFVAVFAMVVSDENPQAQVEDEVGGRSKAG